MDMTGCVAGERLKLKNIAKPGAAQVYERLQECFLVTMTVLRALKGALLEELSGKQENSAAGF